MKTKIYLVLMFIFSIALTSCKHETKQISDLWEIQKVSDIDHYKFKGSVKSYVSRHYAAHPDLDDIAIDSLNGYTNISFDEKGWVVELNDSNRLYNNEQVSIRCSNQDEKTTYTITKNGKETKETTKYYDNNYLTKIEQKSSDKIIETTEVKYNDDRLAVEMTTSDSEGNILSKKSECKFDESNNYISYTYTLGNNENRYLHEYTYSNEGKLTEHHIYDLKSDNKLLLHKEEYKINEEGNTELESTYNYDLEGNLIVKYVVEYNDHGDIIKYLTYNDEDMLLQTIKYDLQYDDAGNILERKEYKDGNIVAITKNEYTYY